VSQINDKILFHLFCLLYFIYILKNEYAAFCLVIVRSGKQIIMIIHNYFFHQLIFATSAILDNRQQIGVSDYIGIEYIVLFSNITKEFLKGLICPFQFAFGTLRPQNIINGTKH